MLEQESTSFMWPSMALPELHGGFFMEGTLEFFCASCREDGSRACWDLLSWEAGLNSNVIAFPGRVLREVPVSYQRPGHTQE
jgi:hypothetical protein